MAPMHAMLTLSKTVTRYAGFRFASGCAANTFPRVRGLTRGYMPSPAPRV